ncbi:MAG: hypothetical protein M3294_09315, partial [Pseudomonadota bacterium]|nr:hypothetical protein [Pseudomonadota bacterium]
VYTSDLPSVQGRAKAKRTVDQYIQQLEQAEQVVVEFKRKAIEQQRQQPVPCGRRLGAHAIVAVIGSADDILKDIVVSTIPLGRRWSGEKDGISCYRLHCLTIGSEALLESAASDNSDQNRFTMQVSTIKMMKPNQSEA